MAWTALLQELVVREPSEQQQAQLLGQLAAEFRRDGTRIIKLVEALGPWLTGEDDAQRARATGVLSEVVEAVPTAAASEGEVGHLTQFFTARLTDWPAVRGALRGCLALVSRQPEAVPPPQPGGQQPSQQAQQLPAPDEAAAVELVRTCVSHVFIRALAAADRQLALRLLAAAMRGYGDALLGANLDLLEYTISSVDGEKDPRCLLLSFDAIQALLELYHRQPEEALCRERLEESAEELFEVLACYFPVTFTPPPNDPNKITRADLAAGLQRTLAAEPLFAPFVVPLIAEKLSSSLRQAKLDALSLVGACAASYGPAPLADHASTLWAALRPELASPAAEGLLPADLAAAEELADAAAAALASCVAAFQRPALPEEDAASSARSAGTSLADAVLQDPLLSDVLACIQAPGQDVATHRRSALRAKVGARAAKALCTCGGSAGRHALAQLLPSLLEAAGQPAAAGSGGSGSSSGSSGSWQSQCLAWAAIVDLLEAAAAAENGGPDGSLVAAAVASSATALAASAQQQAAAAGGEEGEEHEEGGSQKPAERWVLHPSDCSQQQATMLQLALLATVLAAPHLAAGLPVQQVEAAADSTLQQLIAAGSSPARQAQAVAPLRALTSSTHAAWVAERVLPQLVAAAGKPHSAAAALAALRALAETSSGLQLDIVLALDQGIQQQLPAALGPAGSDSSSAALLQQLLAAATAIVSATPRDGPDEAGAAAGVLPLAQHLFDAAMLLPAQAAGAAAPDLVSACAELAFHAVRSAAAEQQQLLAAGAADAWMGQQPVGLQAAVCCALLLPLRSGVAEAAVGDQLAALVELLVRRALGQQSSDAAARWAALAAAALLNKWPQSDADGLGACAAAVMSQQLLPGCGLVSTTSSGSGSSAPAIQQGAWGCLAATTRGLAMRGHKEADAVLHAVVTFLDTAAQRWQQAAAEPGAAPDGLATSVQQAARFLGAALDGSSGSVGLNKLSHAFAKPLWQQRCYTATSRQLLPLLERSQQQALSVSAGGSSSTDGSPHPAQASPVLLLALGHLLQAAPAGVQQQEQQRMLPWLLQCLAGLRDGPLADGDLLLALLLLLSDALMTPSGKQQVEGELLPRLVPALLGLTAFRPSPAVRETALQCLLLLLELPYTALHPYRQAVEKGLAAAVDDKRRAVRLAAARCRQAWSSA